MGDVSGAVGFGEVGRLSEHFQGGVKTLGMPIEMLSAVPTPSPPHPVPVDGVQS